MCIRDRVTTALIDVSVDVAFLGTNGFSVRRGMTTPDQAEAVAKRAMVAAGRRCVVLADSSKAELVHFHRFAELDDVALLITDRRLDEETAEHQRFYQYCVIRQYDLWWHDFTFMAVAVEEAGPRPWIWSDYAWHHPEAFFEKMPKSVVQSNWYYGGEFKPDIAYVKAYDQIEAHGYDQIPTGSNWSTKDNFEGTVRYCSQTIPRERLKGFLQTVWRPTIEEMRPKHLEAIACIERARNAFIEDTNR